MGTDRLLLTATEAPDQLIAALIRLAEVAERRHREELARRTLRVVKKAA